ncbi:MAG: SCO family protein [Rhodospirillales bacterium]|nr:SCO family protein [Rhodospirillales bacterium]
MRRAPSFLLILFLILLGLPGAGAFAASQGPLDPKEALRVSQAAIGRLPSPAHRLVEAGGRAVTLGDYRGKPLVISLVYSSCYQTCPTITQTLAKAIGKARAALGPEGFRVVSIGFDTAKDTPEAMRLFAKSQGVSMEGWEFLSTDPVTLSVLAEELGFIFWASPRGFDHLTQTTILDKEGRVHVQIYGDTFETPLLVEPLKDLVLGRAVAAFSSVESLVDRVRLFCTIYDPATDGYRFSFAIFIEIFMAASSVILAGIFLWRINRRKRSA